MAAQASSTNLKEILSSETSINECKFSDCDISEVLEFSVDGGSLIHIILSHADFSIMCTVKIGLIGERDF